MHCKSLISLEFFIVESNSKAYIVSPTRRVYYFCFLGR